MKRSFCTFFLKRLIWPNALKRIPTIWTLLGVVLCTGTQAALVPIGVQSFIEEAPPDVFVGPVVMNGQVVHRAVDGSWIKIHAQSNWGKFTYLVTRVGGGKGSLPQQSGTPRVPPGAVAGREIPWNGIQSNNQSWLRLEGEITATRDQGAELEGQFAFKDEIVHLRMKLVENIPLGSNPVPTFRNVYYGPDVRQKMDVYLAKAAGPTPVAVYIHGGAWINGDKTTLSEQRVFLDAGISVIAIDYRYIPSENPSPSVPAVAIPLGDAARAIQFIRSKAAEWGLAKDRIGIWGASAGACTSLWLATHPDLADPSSPDPVLRESTRVTCAAALMAQTSLDPVQMRAWVGPELTYGPHAFAVHPASPGGDAFAAFIAERERLMPWIRSYSPAALLTPASSPIYLDYLDFSLTPCEPLSAYYTHSPGFGVGFSQLARRVGAECHLRFQGQEDENYPNWETFLIAKLTGKAAGSPHN